MLFIDNFNSYKKKIDDILSILFYFLWKNETEKVLGALTNELLF